MTSPSLSSDVRSNSEILLNFPVFVSQKTGARQITLFHTCIIPVNLCRWCGNMEGLNMEKLDKITRRAFLTASAVALIRIAF